MKYETRLVEAFRLSDYREPILPGDPDYVDADARVPSLTPHDPMSKLRTEDVRRVVNALSADLSEPQWTRVRRAQLRTWLNVAEEILEECETRDTADLARDIWTSSPFALPPSP